MKNFVLLIVALAFVVGCGKAETPLVAGKGVLKDAQGEPLGGIMLNFMPDVREGNSGPTSSATTNDQGEFVLKSIDGKRDGVVPGKHRVTAFDTKEERPAQGEEAEGPTSRVPSIYQTEDGALTVEVVEGQDIELQIKEPAN